MTVPNVSYELPHALDAAALAAVVAPAFGLHAEVARRRVRTFYDTFDGLVHETGAVLVHEAGELELVGADGLVLAAEPWPRAPRRLLVHDLPDGPLRAALARPVDVRALTPLVRVAVREQLLRVLDAEEKTVVRLTVQEPRLDGGARLTSRLRVTPVRGYDKAIAKVTRLLERSFELNAVGESLCDEAVRRAGGIPGGVSSKPAVALEPQDRGDAAAARICLRLLEIFEHNLPGTLADVDSEFLHDLRVSVRRTRSLQRELRGVFPAEALAHFRAEFRWLQNITGPSRDLDVYVLEFDDFRDTLPPARRGDLESLHDLLVHRRTAAHRRMRRELRSARAHTVVREWAALLAAMQAQTVGGPDAATPVVQLASARIARVHRQMVKAGRAIHEDTPAPALHDLRKKGKELRYLLEFFAPLYPAGVIKPMVANLKLLQDTLGRFQDREVQASLVASLADDVHGMDDATTALMAMGLLMERLHEQQHQARGEFAERFAHFAAKEQLVLVRKTFG